MPSAAPVLVKGVLRQQGAAAVVTDLAIAADSWRLVEAGAAAPGVIAPLAAWRRAPEGAGVWVDGGAEVEDLATELVQAPVVAVRFPVFADGRGLSLGVLLRSRYGYVGELRAFGEIIPDLTEYMRRCGFDAFMLPNRCQAEAAIRCMERMSDHYQGSVREPVPPYGRQPGEKQA